MIFDVVIFDIGASSAGFPSNVSRFQTLVSLYGFTPGGGKCNKLFHLNGLWQVECHIWLQVKDTFFDPGSFFRRMRSFAISHAVCLGGHVFSGSQN